MARWIDSNSSLTITCSANYLPRFPSHTGFVQGSLLPWVILEFYVGNPSMDVYWMPTTHMLVFFAVVHVYDWLQDVPAQKEAEVGGDLGCDDDDESVLLV